MGFPDIMMINHHIDISGRNGESHCFFCLKVGRKKKNKKMVSDNEDNEK